MLKPVELLVKFTVRGAGPLVGDPVKSAVGKVSIIVGISLLVVVPSPN